MDDIEKEKKIRAQKAKDDKCYIFWKQKDYQRNWLFTNIYSISK